MPHQAIISILYKEESDAANSSYQRFSNFYRNKVVHSSTKNIGTWHAHPSFLLAFYAKLAPKSIEFKATDTNAMITDANLGQGSQKTTQAAGLWEVNHLRI
ncbi:hypothetical protein AMTR_s00038p00123100 [Amborella trichopoda]|uniref:Uncharacterized protein n=1 Tax=Amborella trichopoda TaxID=13333 RepID=U5D2K8_AMBTC|nr:hypothetical protein AMTR_s00038p00123100 [Amborella trichopoda]